jgi:signal transduction histidine kinase
VAAGEPRTTEYRWRTAQGEYRWFLDAAMGSRDALGKPNQIVGIWLDITRRKQAEEARRKSERQLRRLLHEREQLGRDLHDDIIQSLYAAGLSLGECRQLLDADLARAKRLLNHAAAGLNSVLRDIRRFIPRMEPVSLGRQPLGTAVRSLARKMNATGSMHWTVRVDSHANDRLKPAEAASLLQVIKEAMSNSVRHSKADLGLVSVQFRNNEVVASVEDNGEGFNLSRIRDTSGRGIENITARADQLAAELKINSTSGQGTQIRLRIPRGKPHAVVGNQNPRPHRG